MQLQQTPNGISAPGLFTYTERNLLSRTLGWLGLSLGITAASSYLWTTDTLRLPFLLIIIAWFGLAFAMRPIAKASNEMAILGICAFAFVGGQLIAPAIMLKLQVDPGAVTNALTGTVIIFMVCAGIVWMTTYNFGAWAKWLFGALFVGIILMIASFFIPISMLALNLFLGGVFVGLTLFDFWRVKQDRINDNNSILLAVSLYLDFLNLFLILLRIFSKK